MSDLNAFFAPRDGRKPRIYRDYIVSEDAAQSSGADDFEAQAEEPHGGAQGGRRRSSGGNGPPTLPYSTQAEQNSPFEETAQDHVAFPTGTGIIQSFQGDGNLSVFQRRQKAILENLKVKTVGLADEEADDSDDCNDCNLHSLLPRAGFTKKAAAANWEDTEDSPSSAYPKKSYGREASSSYRNAGVDWKIDGSSARPTRGELGVGTRPLLRGGEGIYRPPMRGSGEVCPPKEDCEEETQRTRVRRSSWIGRTSTRPINASDALASGSGSWANNSYGASTGGQRGCEGQSSRVDDEEIVVRFSSARSTRMNKKFDTRGISGSGASASGGGASASGGGALESGNRDSSSGNESSGRGALASGSRGGLPDRRDGAGSSAVCLPRNADAGSTDGSSSGAAGRLPGAVNRLTLRGSGGFYKPPMRGLGEVCPPKKESK